MTIKFTATTAESGLQQDLGQLILKLNSVIEDPKHEWDLRTIFSALTALTENYREVLRSLWTGDKDQFDAFIDSMSIYIQSYTSDKTRPMIERAFKETKKPIGDQPLNRNGIRDERLDDEIERKYDYE